MARVRERYDRRAAEKRFESVYVRVNGDRCIYCGMPSAERDHQPPVYVLHRFADGGLVTKNSIRARFGECRLVPCCTICNMGLGSYHGIDDNDRRREIANWFLPDPQFPLDRLTLVLGQRLLKGRFDGKRGQDIYAFPGVGRVIYLTALIGLMRGEFNAIDAFPDWLKQTQSELAEWFRAAPRRSSQYFLDMANLESYNLLPHARDNPRGQFTQ